MSGLSNFNARREYHRILTELFSDFQRPGKKENFIDDQGGHRLHRTLASSWLKHKIRKSFSDMQGKGSYAREDWKPR